MYLNWYNNFWQFMREIGAIDKFIPSPVIGYRLPGDKQRQTRAYLTNAGSPTTILTNMLNGIASPADQFLSAYSLLDLIGTQWMSGGDLEQTSVKIFFAPEAIAPTGRWRLLLAPWRRPSRRRAICRRREAIRA